MIYHRPVLNFIEVNFICSDNKLILYRQLACGWSHDLKAFFVVADPLHDEQLKEKTDAFIKSYNCVLVIKHIKKKTFFIYILQLPKLTVS